MARYSMVRWFVVLVALLWSVGSVAAAETSGDDAGTDPGTDAAGGIAAPPDALGTGAPWAPQRPTDAVAVGTTHEDGTTTDAAVADPADLADLLAVLGMTLQVEVVHEDEGPSDPQDGREPAPAEPAKGQRQDEPRDGPALLPTPREVAAPLPPVTEVAPDALGAPLDPLPLLPEVRPPTAEPLSGDPEGPPAPATAFAPASSGPAAPASTPASAQTVGAVVAVAAVASGAAAMTQSGAPTWLRRVFGLGLFSRLSRSEVLDHETRQAILDHLRVNPGTSVTELQELVGRSINSVTHHLRVLETNGLVRGMKSGRRRCYFALDDRRSAKERVAIATLTSESTRRVFTAIAKRPGICQRDLASLLDIAPTSVVFHARRLEEAGVIRRAREGRLMAYFPADGVTA